MSPTGFPALALRGSPAEKMTAAQRVALVWPIRPSIKRAHDFGEVSVPLITCIVIAQVFHRGASAAVTASGHVALACTERDLLTGQREFVMATFIRRLPDRLAVAVLCVLYLVTGVVDAERRRARLRSLGQKGRS